MFGRSFIKKILVLCICFGLVTFLLFSSRVHEDQISDGFLHHQFSKLTDQIANWIESEVLGISYEERFCKHLSVWNKSSAYPPISTVAKHLNIRNGDLIFVNGLHCGEWLIALRGLFPNVILYGVDMDSDSVQYVNKMVNGTFKQSQPFELDKLDFGRNIQFDHAIVDSVLSIYPPDWQCKTIKQMIPMLKAGGSLYIGKNFEHSGQHLHEQHLRKHSHVRLLPKCFWSKVCLLQRSDIVEVLYSKESTLLDTLQVNDIAEEKDRILIDVTMCATSVFIYKHIMVNRRSKNLLPKSKYQDNIHNHPCTYSETMNATQDKISDDIKKAVMNMKMQGLDMH
ncbi:uncharacterized protein LOC105844630 [Hydra vulgaris]|uniref:Uncharacterized protein LOC105844630 n=1 Tax=Hydra vulgaris TaxID=6087 RepID=A0ABM4C4R6_HYDVU